MQKLFSKSINEAIFQSMEEDKNVICYGLGVNDPKRIFGTTSGLVEKFGSDRVFDMPTSENAMLGVGIGCSLGGIKPIMIHQRLDFFLLAMDQLVNSAAKWHYMFGSKFSIPITIRLIMGRGWGQGPTHSQNLQAWFSHIPGLKVYMPSNPIDAKKLLYSAILDPNPILILEHRWLYNSQDEVPNKVKAEKKIKAKVIKKGRDITIVSMSYLTVEAIHASNYLKNYSISCEIIDLRSAKPIDSDTITRSLKKTGRLLVLDTGFTSGSLAGEIIAKQTIENFNFFKNPPMRLAMPDVPEPTSHALIKDFYIRAFDISKIVLKTFGIKKFKDKKEIFNESIPHDVPGDWFSGPF